jgi:MFS family permease
VLLGAGWSTFYALAPLLVVHCVQPQMRLKYFAMSGGAQAAGLGLASPLGHAANSAFGTLSSVYLAFAALCLISTLSLAAAGHLLRRQPRMPLTALTVTRELAVSVLRNRTLAPITMIALAACVMGGFSTYQTAYAESRHLSPDVFFVVFTVTVVLARFTVAPSIGRVPMSSLAFGQCSTMLVALLLYVLNPGSYLLYVIATILFATGYCLVFSTLNAFAMKLAAEDGLSVAATSQVFTLGYFIGLFGFPFIAGVVLSYAGPSRLVVAMMVLIAINLVVLQILERTTAPSLSERVTRRPEPGTLSCAARANSGLAHSPSDAGGPSS